MKRVSMNRLAVASVMLTLALGSSVPAATGPFSLDNGYFSLSGDNGMVTSLRLDATGAGSYGANTIAASGHLAFVLNGTLMTDPSADWTVNGSSISISGLPGFTTVSITLAGAQMTAQAQFGGFRTIQHEWDLVYVDDGFYQRTTGSNYNPNVAIDMPFVDFYSTANGSFRAVEMFKRTAGPAEAGDPRETGWPGLHCRGRGANSVAVSGSHGGGALVFAQFEPQENELTLMHGSASANYLGNATLTIVLEPKDFSVTLDGNRPLPEFYVLPAKTINGLSDPSVGRDASELLSQFYHHMTYWWGPQGHSGGIWTDWGAVAGIFQDTPFRESVATAIFDWIVADDGYGNVPYAYTWGTEIGWPFPEGRDTRHFNTNAILLKALWRYIMWTGDIDSLNEADSGSDRTMTIVYESTGSTGRFPAWNSAPLLGEGDTHGQSFTATSSFTAVRAFVATHAQADSGCTLTLYDAPGGTAIASQTYSNIPDNSDIELSFPAQPGGTYYLEMSDPVGMITWWTQTDDLYAGGIAYINGFAPAPMIDLMRDLMDYQQTVLLGASSNQIVTGSNIGSSDHGGRHADIGGNYYDILPFGYHDALTDIHYYQSVRALADLEDMVGNPAAANQWRARMAQTRDTFDQTYWRTGLDRNSDESRYIGCVDVDGVDHDYGYTFINTMAIAAGLAQSRPDRVESVFDWIDHGEVHHSPAYPAERVRIGYDSGPVRYNMATDVPFVPIQLVSTLEQEFFADAPFSSVASQNPTWGQTDSDFTLTLLRAGTGETIATLNVVDAVNNAFNTLTFASQPAGYYILRMTNPNGLIGWWGSEWSSTIYDRWVMPRVSTLDNQDWWQAAALVGLPPNDPNFAYHWDVQLQNGGADLYESGFDIWARARWHDADSAWERLEWLLRRWLDPDRMSGNASFYGHGIQGGSQGAGSIGWCWSEFPETGVLGAAFFNGFLGVDPSARGLRFQPAIPTGHGITTVGARNISYFGALFDIEATVDSITFTCTSNPSGRTFYMTGGFSNAGTFTRTIPLDRGAAILSHRPQEGIGELTLSFARSNETSYVAATFDGEAIANYVLQSSENLLSNDWNTVSAPFTSDTNIVVETTNHCGFYRGAGD